MSNLRFFTAGESHGKALAGTIEGIPSNLSLSPDDIDNELKRRQSGMPSIVPARALPCDSPAVKNLRFDI